MDQINGREMSSQKLDGESVKKMNFMLEVKIFFKTVFSVLRSEGIKEGASSAD